MGEPKNKPPSGGGEPVPTTQATKTLLERAQTGERFTPAQLAELTGNTITLKPNITFGGAPFESVRYSALHQGAAQLHGWAAHEHHGKEPFTLTLDQYIKALEAAGNGGAPYAPACSEHLPTAHKAAAEAAAKTQKGNG